MLRLKTNRRLILLILINILTANTLQAQKNDSTNTLGLLCSIKLDKPRFTVSLGTFLSNNSSGLSVGSEKLGVGLIVNLEEALQLEKNTIVLRADLNYNFGDRLQHGLTLNYFDISRSSSIELDTEIKIDEYTFNIGENIKSRFNLSMIEFKYSYSFLCDSRVDLAITGGLIVMPINFNIQSENFKSQNADIIAPLPILGFSSRYLIFKNIYMRQSTDLLYLSADKYKADIIDINIAIEHEPIKHFRYGLGLNSFKLNFHANNSDYLETNFFGDINMDLSGIIFYLKYCL